jgi:hypothetical protein
MNLPPAGSLPARATYPQALEPSRTLTGRTREGEGAEADS